MEWVAAHGSAFTYPLSAPLLYDVLHPSQTAYQLTCGIIKPSEAASKQLQVASPAWYWSLHLGCTPGRCQKLDVAVRKVSLLQYLDIWSALSRQVFKEKGPCSQLGCMLTRRNSCPTAPVVPTIAIVGPLDFLPAWTLSCSRREQPGHLCAALSCLCGALPSCMDKLGVRRGKCGQGRRLAT